VTSREFGAFVVADGVEGRDRSESSERRGREKGLDEKRTSWRFAQGTWQKQFCVEAREREASLGAPGNPPRPTLSPSSFFFISSDTCPGLRSPSLFAWSFSC
jgi:hypothetical protein